MVTRRLALQVAVVGMLGLGVAACNTGSSGNSHHTTGMDMAVGMNLEPSSRTIMQGEVATIAAHTENLLGRDSEIRWLAPGGDLRIEENGRVARVMYDMPGTYTVTADLMVDGRQTLRDQSTIHVNPLK
jgi:hypothetical protein